jgi:hypothetical protein
MWGTSWRPDLRLDEVARELAIIHDDLHCNAVRICGEDLDRLVSAARAAIEAGLEVWLSPELWDRTPEETLEYIATAADRMQKIHELSPGHVVLSVGSEVTLFMNGIVPGNTVFERLSHPQFWETARSGAHNARLNDFLEQAAEQARRRFGGPLTYASVPLEAVDWSRFDLVSVDLYREARVRDQFPQLVRRYLGHGRPVVITESGCCTYRGAAAAGGRGFEILDIGSGRGATPARLKGDYVRDESEQARELTEILSIFDQAGVDGIFLMTFISPLNPYSVEPKFDLDMASFSLVRSYGGRLGEFGLAFPDAPWERTRTGRRYTGLPWDPKESFDAVADFYASQPALTGR